MNIHPSKKKELFEKVKMSENEIDFSFIQEVGSKIYEILINDADQIDWFYDIQDNPDKISINTSEIISTIIEYLKSLGDEYSQTIVKDIKTIIKDEENNENLLNFIFFPNFGGEEEEDEAEESIKEVQPSLIEDDEQSLDPQSYFEKIIQKTMNILSISHDITYLLLKKFQWKEGILIQHWLSEQDKILNSLKIHIGSEMIPTLKSPLKIRNSSIGECPICYSEEPLLELYCGHKICQDCFKEEIKSQILENKLPVCRQMHNDENKGDNYHLCSAEIMYEDVKELLLNTCKDTKLFEKYSQIFLNGEIYVDPLTKYCTNQYCNYIITANDELPCHVGRCPMCYTAMCLKCSKGAHAPLIDCNKIDDFLITQAEAMENLNEHQKQWLKHEKKMSLYRFNHPEDVRSKFQEEIQIMRSDHKQKSAKDQEKINNIDSLIKGINDEINKLENKEQKSKNEIDHLQELILDRDSKIHSKSRLEMEKAFHEQDRLDNISTLEKEEHLFMSAILDPSNYENFMYQFEQTINQRAIESISQQLKENENLIEAIYKKCPQCQTPIERTQGCNHMTCQICRYEFCYICGQEWIGHDDYYICSNYSFNYRLSRSSTVNYFYEDLSFILPPMTAEKKAEYLRWNDLYSQHKFQSEKYDQLFNEFSNKKDENPAPGKKGLTFAKLCTRNKIAHILLRDTDRKFIKKKTLKIMNTLLFAQSLLVWGPPALFYMNDNKKKAMLIEYKLSLLEDSKNKFLNLIYKPGESNSEDYDENVDILNRQIIDILKMAEL